MAFIRRQKWLMSSVFVLNLKIIVLIKYELRGTFRRFVSVGRPVLSYYAA